MDILSGYRFPRSVYDSGARHSASPLTTLALLCGMNLLDYNDRNILAAVLPHIQTEMGLSSTQARRARPGLPHRLHDICPADGLGWRPLQPDPLLVCGVGLWSLATVGAGSQIPMGISCWRVVCWGLGRQRTGHLLQQSWLICIPESAGDRSYPLLPGRAGRQCAGHAGGLIEPHYGWRGVSVVGGPGLAALSGLLLREPPRRHGQCRRGGTLGPGTRQGTVRRDYSFEATNPTSITPSGWH